jgi:hypothetical protein
MSTSSAATRSSTHRSRRHRQRRRQGTRCVTMDVTQGERNALVITGYLTEEERDSGPELPLERDFSRQRVRQRQEL